MNRLEEKDLEAFRVVLRKTGHPSEPELIRELQFAVDLFRPGFDEENAADLTNNTHRLWPLLYGRVIDVRAEIIAPALAKRRVGYRLPRAITNKSCVTDERAPGAGRGRLARRTHAVHLAGETPALQR